MYGQTVHNRIRSEVFGLTRAPISQFDCAFLKATRTNNHFPRTADEIDGRKLAARPLVPVIIKNIKSSGSETLVKAFTSRIGVSIPLLEIDDGDLEGRDAFRPNDPFVIMAGLNDPADKTRNADAVRTTF